ncbi:hypothetical protein ACSNOI_32450 [Actinomadura kijaniata]|uniref:hypothetical protein n=1 Tax=Actinomadura kijaniata TaxID=46161 RepID=UPI003F1A30F6
MSAEANEKDAEAMNEQGERAAAPGVPLPGMRCCICGGDANGAGDYVLLTLTSAHSSASQMFGAHAEHLQSVLAPGFTVEIHLM